MPQVMTNLIECSQGTSFEIPNPKLEPELKQIARGAPIVTTCGKQLEWTSAAADLPMPGDESFVKNVALVVPAFKRALHHPRPTYPKIIESTGVKQRLQLRPGLSKRVGKGVMEHGTVCCGIRKKYIYI